LSFWTKPIDAGHTGRQPHVYAWQVFRAVHSVSMTMTDQNAATADQFHYRRKELCCEGVRLADLARRVGTPFYVYSRTAIETHFLSFERAFANTPHLICYAMKANSNLSILSIMRRLGAGFDIVSGGELMRALRVRCDPGTIVFSGVGKTEEEIDLALHHGILQFNVESEAELGMLEARAAACGKVAPVALRVNPDVEVKTHPYITTGLAENKFGVPVTSVLPLYRRASRSRHLRVTGMGFHIGSQITSMTPFARAAESLAQLVRTLHKAGIGLLYLDLGGGLGIRYDEEEPPPPGEYAKAFQGFTRDLGCSLILEPGRAIVGNAGALVTRVILTKKGSERNFVVVDAAMNDLVRPSLYGAFHRIVPLKQGGRRTWKTDVVGPVCESGDFLARDRILPRTGRGALLAVMSAGAYGFALSSNYNSRTRPAEVLVHKGAFRIIRSRETFHDLIRRETAKVSPDV
jgi:diaminopimelate decarboxylase